MLTCKERFGLDAPDDMYIKTTICDNCGRQAQVLIPKGTKKADVALEPCFRCGCRTVRLR